MQYNMDKGQNRIMTFAQLNDLLARHEESIVARIEGIVLSTVNRTLEKTGSISPFINKQEAYTLYGRSTVDRWIRERLLVVQKDSDSQSAQCRIRRDDIDKIASQCNHPKNRHNDTELIS